MYVASTSLLMENVCQGGIQYFFIERYLSQHKPLVHVNGALMMLKSILLVLELKSYMTRAYQTWKEKTFKKKWRHILVIAMITLGTEFIKLTRFFISQ